MDKQTLKDLEIFEAEEDNACLFAMFDNTLTTGGSMALKRRFQHPFTQIEPIHETQEIIRYFLQYIDDWTLSINEDEVRYVEKYVASTIVVFDVSGGVFDWFTAKNFQVAHPDFFYFLANGINVFLRFLNRLETFLNKHGTEKKPQYIVVLLQKVHDLVVAINSKIQFQNELSNAPALSVLIADRLLRSQYRDKVDDVLNVFYEVDALFSMAKSCDKYRLHFPEFKSDNSSINIVALRHLFIPNCTTNDFHSGSRNFVFLTGPNMSGKTTFLKALCVLIFLAHLGMGVPAQSASLPVFDDVFTSINIEDSLHKKQSYFFSEVTRVKEMATLLHQGKHLFVVMDEMFRGTNLKDAIDCSLMVINKLIDWNSSFFILASHIAELGDMLPDEKVSFKYFESTVVGGEPVFSHKCNNGISFEHLGTLILINAGIPNLLKTKDHGV